MITQPRHFVLPFIKKEQVAKETYSFYFDRTQLSYDFLPGQYNRVFLDLLRTDDRGDSRQFTICSSPLQKEFLMITTKIFAKPSAFKERLFQLNSGEEVRFFGPQGKFVLPETSEKPLVFLAGGIGITPFHSMLISASLKKIDSPITFIISFSTVEEVLFYDELKALEVSNPNIKIIYTITHPEESHKEWSGETGRITEEMIKKYIKDIHEQEYLLCGPPVMVTAMNDLVIGMGITEDKIKKEQLTGY